MRVIRDVCVVVFALCLLGYAGCSKEELSQATDTLQEKLSGAAETVKETVSETALDVRDRTGLGGTIELNLDEPVTVGGCYVSLGAVSDELPCVLQVTGYPAPHAERFPSVLLRAQVDAQQPAALIGKHVSATVFVQAEEDGPVWYSPPDRPAELLITSVGDEGIEGTLDGALTQTGSGQTVDVRGTFSGQLQ